MLSTLDIMRLLRGVKWFSEVFPIYRLPCHVTKPKAFIISLDESYKEGSHWVAFYFDRNGRAKYFDSFGRQPRGNILTFIERNAKNGYDFNNKKYQGNLSVACGYFSVLFVLSCKDFDRFDSFFEKCKHERNERRLMIKIKRFIKS